MRFPYAVVRTLMSSFFFLSLPFRATSYSRFPKPRHYDISSSDMSSEPTQKLARTAKPPQLFPSTKEKCLLMAPLVYLHVSLLELPCFAGQKPATTKRVMGGAKFALLFDLGPFFFLLCPSAAHCTLHTARCSSCPAKHSPVHHPHFSFLIPLFHYSIYSITLDVIGQTLLPTQ